MRGAVTRFVERHALDVYFCVVCALPMLTVMMVFGIWALRIVGCSFPDTARSVVAVTDQLWPVQIGPACVGIAISVKAIRPPWKQVACFALALTSVPLVWLVFVVTHWAIILTCTGW
jgi:hypothetical protein